MTIRVFGRLENGIAPMGGNGKFKLCDLFAIVYVIFMEICLKAPGNYSDQFWSNKVSVLLCEGPELDISMIYGFGALGELLFMDLYYTRILQAI